MGTPEYKDVLRVEEVKDGLAVRLRNKQLGFERIVTGENVEVRMGYKDSTGVLHYFNEGGGPGTEFWEPFDTGIKYQKADINASDVAIGSAFARRRLEVAEPRSTVNWQMRVSHSSSGGNADIGIDQYNKFRITVNDSDRLSMTPDGFDLNCPGGSIKYYSGELLFENETTTRNVKIKAAESGSILLEPGDTGSVYIGNELIFQDELNGRVIYDGTADCFEMYSDLHLEDGNHIRFDSDDCMISGDDDNNLILKGYRYIDAQSIFLKLPVKTTTGHPVQTAEEGCMYINKADKKLFLYIDAAWRQVLSW